MNKEQETLWRWTFTTWPTRKNMDQGIVDNIAAAMMRPRHEAYYTEPEFHAARLQVIEHGWVLRDIERWPIAEPVFVAMLPEEYTALHGDVPTAEDLKPQGRWHHEQEHPSQF